MEPCKLFRYIMAYHLFVSFAADVLLPSFHRFSFAIPSCSQPLRLAVDGALSHSDVVLLVGLQKRRSRIRLPVLCPHFQHRKFLSRLHLSHNGISVYSHFLCTIGENNLGIFTIGACRLCSCLAWCCMLAVRCRANPRYLNALGSCVKP